MSQDGPVAYHRASSSFSQLQPRAKASATTSSSSPIIRNNSSSGARNLQAAPQKDPHSTSRAVTSSSGATTARLPTTPARTLSSSDQSERANVYEAEVDRIAVETFVKNTLCPQTDTKRAVGNINSSIHDLLPPLTSSNDVDFELYALLAIVVHLYLDSWYKRITPDTEFVHETIQIVAHCTRGLEQRLRQLNWESLVLDELPRLLDAHVEARSTALAVKHTSHTTGVDAVYHTLRPHPALEPAPQPGESTEAHEERAQNDQSFRMLVSQGLLAVLLPTEDLQNPCLFALLSEVLADLVLGEFISRRFCESAFIFNGIAKTCGAVQEKLRSKIWLADPTASKASAVPKTRLEQFGLLNFDKPPGTQANRKSLAWSNFIVDSFWAFVHYVTIGIFAINTFLAALAASQSFPQRPNLPHHSIANRIKRSNMEGKNTPVLCMHVWPTAGNLVGFRPRMPWLCGFLSLVRHLLISGPGRLGDTNGRLDRLLSYHLTSPLRDPDFIPFVLRTLRIALYPDFPAFTAVGARPPTDGSTSQLLEAVKTARRHAAIAVLNTMPRFVAERYFCIPSDYPATDAEESMITQMEELLTRAVGGPAVPTAETVDDSSERDGQDGYTTRHLVYTVVELLISRAVPELREAEHGVDGGYGAPSLTDLLADRGVGSALDE